MRLSTIHSTLTTFALSLIAIGSGLFWIMQGRPHVYPDAPAGKFACLSYTPLKVDSNVDSLATIHAQIERDMEQLSHRSQCVRTYSVLNGLDHVPAVARKLGMRVLLGIWIGRDPQANEMEINAAIATAAEYPDVIDAIVVGNEVLLRREQSMETLYAMLQRVHAATQLPVTYADVWDFWLQNPKLAEATSFISIHILPYWENQPIGVEQTMAHVENIYRKMQQTFPGHHIYVGEIGWPSAGRQREGARPSLVNQARFTRDFIALANEKQIPYNFIEAYDQTWKKGQEGTVGGYWGLYDAEGREKFPLTGPVVADAKWWRGPLAGIIAAIALLLAAPLAMSSRSRTQRIQLALAGFSLGCLVVMQWDYLWQSNRNWQEWLAMCGWTLIGHAVFLLSLFDRQTWRPRLTAGLLFALLFCVAYINLGLAFSGRYRDFPSMFLLLPTAMLALNGLRRSQQGLSGETVLLSTWLLVSAALIAVNEGGSNGSALLWCGLSALLGGSLLIARSGLLTRQLSVRQVTHQ
ncbi:MAG: glycoside hydrolase family 17 [Steroidobacteraceae bacterium]